MKIISWNINGIRAWKDKPNTLDFLEKESADIVCFQETKAQEEQIEKLTGVSGFFKEKNHIFRNYDFHFWNSAEKKGYSGTGIISKEKPIKVWYGMKNSPIENEVEL